MFEALYMIYKKLNTSLGEAFGLEIIMRSYTYLKTIFLDLNDVVLPTGSDISGIFFTRDLPEIFSLPTGAAHSS